VSDVIGTGKITSEQFRRAFKEEWECRYHGNEQELNDKYPKARQWTEFMKGAQGVLESVMQRLGERHSLKMQYKSEWYTVDALYVRSDETKYGTPTEPTGIYAIIEHENADDVEVEMWKLIYWRCPLKVLIFYDWSDKDRKFGDRDEKFKKKLKDLAGMLEETNEFHDEADDTEYLFIVGSRKERNGENDQIYWRWGFPGIDELLPLC